MYPECFTRFENGLLPVDAVCAIRADGCREHGKRHRDPGPCLGHNLDLYCVGNSSGNDATLHIRQKQAVSTRSAVRPNPRSFSHCNPPGPECALNRFWAVTQTVSLRWLNGIQRV